MDDLTTSIPPCHTSATQVKPRKEHTLAVRLDKEDIDILRKCSDHQRISMAEIVRQAIRRYAKWLLGLMAVGCIGAGNCNDHQAKAFGETLGIVAIGCYPAPNCNQLCCTGLLKDRPVEYCCAGSSCRIARP